MVKITKSQLPPELQDLLNRKSNKRHYSDGDVMQICIDDNHKKCYICESGGEPLQAEHVKAHRGNKDLEYDWQNILPACVYCNSMKRHLKYDNILNCCTHDPEDYLVTSMADELTIEINVYTPHENNPQAVETKSLLESVYNNVATAQRRDYSPKLRRKVVSELNKLKNALDSYANEPDAHLRESFRQSIIKLTMRCTPFAAIKRDYIKSIPAYKCEFGIYLS